MGAVERRFLKGNTHSQFLNRLASDILTTSGYKQRTCGSKRSATNGHGFNSKGIDEQIRLGGEWEITNQQ